MTAQVAEITKPLASVTEMVDSWHLVIMHKTGAIAKRLSPDTERRIKDLVEGERPRNRDRKEWRSFHFPRRHQGGEEIQHKRARIGAEEAKQSSEDGWEPQDGSGCSSWSRGESARSTVE